MSRPEVRVRRFINSARKIVDASHPLGIRAREELPELTGLSPEGVEFALKSSLEVNASAQEIAELCAFTPQVERAHVLLSANVFVASLRAVALGLAASKQVYARSSRREPLMLRLLEEASLGAFRVVDELVPLPGDHLWAYGSDETLDSLRGELPAGVILHPHGSGFGVAVLEQAALEEHGASWEVALDEALVGLAQDIGLFDQRGCLSPRLLLVQGSEEFASQVSSRLARELSAFEARVPRGQLSSDEAADVALYRDTMAYAGQLFFAGKGCVGLAVSGERLMLAPVGRHLHVVRTEQPLALVDGLRSVITSFGVEARAGLEQELRTRFPRARFSRFGWMQRPRLDGPVDKRSDAAGMVI